MAHVTTRPASGRSRDLLILASLALLKILIHIPVLTRYGYSFDEPYFIACGRHLSFGYVDHAPLVPWIARLASTVFGDSLFGLRILATLSTALAVFLTGLLARSLGGGRFAQTASAVGMMIAPVCLRSGNMLCLSAFEPLFWIAASLLVVRLVRTRESRLWIWVGVAVGLGLLNKHSMLFFGFGLLVGMLLGPLRRELRGRWFYAGVSIAVLLISPNIIWQMRHDWPTLHFVMNLNEGVMSGISPLQFIAGQFLYLHPFNAVLWLPGLYFLLVSRAGRPYRVLGWIWLFVFAVLLLAKSKIYYLAPAYPILLAAGGVALERSRAFTVRRRLRGALMAALAAGGVALAPLALPYWDIDRTEDFVDTITLGRFENVYEVTGDLRSMFGAEARVGAVAEAYNALSPRERERAVVWASHYGYAGEIDLHGRRHGLPGAVSLDLTYWVWGIPGDRAGDIVVLAGYSEEDIEHLFSEIETVAELDLDHVNPWQTPFRVIVARSPVEPLAEIWRRNRPW